MPTLSRLGFKMTLFSKFSAAVLQRISFNPFVAFGIGGHCIFIAPTCLYANTEHLFLKIKRHGYIEISIQNWCLTSPKNSLKPFKSITVIFYDCFIYWKKHRQIM